MTEIQNIEKPQESGRSWYVYIVRCADHSLYTGISTDIERRLNEHNHSRKLAAAYTRARRPVTLVYQERVSSRSIALKREYEIKQMNPQSKGLLIKDDKI